MKQISKKANSRLQSVLNIKILPDCKRSQITPFIIIAIIIIVVIAVYFLSRTELKKSSPEIIPINNFVNDCIEKVAEDSVYHVSETGGYFFAPSLSTDNHIAYYLYEKKNYMLSKEKIEEELNKYVNNMLFFCTKNFEDFEDFQIKQKKIETKTIIENEKVIFTIKYPLSIKKGENSYILEKFSYEVPVRLGIIYEVIKQIMEEQMKKPEAICINCIVSLAEENDVYVELMDYENNIVIFFIIDRNSIVKEKTYVFNFANKYE